MSGLVIYDQDAYVVKKKEIMPVTTDQAVIAKLNMSGYGPLPRRAIIINRPVKSTAFLGGPKPISLRFLLTKTNDFHPLYDEGSFQFFYLFMR